MTDIYGPVVNLNGADRRDLIKDHVRVMSAANELYKAIVNCAPHGRDYQTASDGTYSKDRALHAELVRQVDLISRQYRRIAERLATERETA